MRKERQVLADRIITMSKDLEIAMQAEKDGLITETELYWFEGQVIPDREQAESDFLGTYSTDGLTLPSWADNLGAYDQYQKDNAAGIYR